MIIKFSGCYHGHADFFLISAGSGAMTLGTPSSPGVTKSVSSDTLVAEYNNLDSVKRLFRTFKNRIACVIVEPVAGNMGTIPPEDGFLQGLREITEKEGALLIFDEVMTGFRVSRGGAQELYGVEPDITTLGKVIGGGLPIGAYGGRREIMKMVSPDGPMYQAGTLSGNPVAVSAGLATLNKLLDEHFYIKLENFSAKLEKGIRELVEKYGIPATINRVGSMFTLFFKKGRVTTLSDVNACDMELFKRYFHGLLKRGIYIPPSQFEANFLSIRHDDHIVEETLNRIEDTFKEIGV